MVQPFEYWTLNVWYLDESGIRVSGIQIVTVNTVPIWIPDTENPEMHKKFNAQKFYRHSSLSIQNYFIQ